jgi:hypothetical protein
MAIPMIDPTTTPAIQALLVGGGTGTGRALVSVGDDVVLALVLEEVEAILDELGVEEEAPVNEVRPKILSPGSLQTYYSAELSLCSQ